MKKSDDEVRSAKSKELKESKDRLQVLNDNLVLLQENNDAKMSSNYSLQIETDRQLKELRAKLTAENGPYKSLVKAYNKEESKNAKYTEEKKRTHTAKKALDAMNLIK